MQQQFTYTINSKNRTRPVYQSIPSSYVNNTNLCNRWSENYFTGFHIFNETFKKNIQPNNQLFNNDLNYLNSSLHKSNNGYTLFYPSKNCLEYKTYYYSSKNNSVNNKFGNSSRDNTNNNINTNVNYNLNINNNNEEKLFSLNPKQILELIRRYPAKYIDFQKNLTFFTNKTIDNITENDIEKFIDNPLNLEHYEKLLEEVKDDNRYINSDFFNSINYNNKNEEEKNNSDYDKGKTTNNLNLNDSNNLTVPQNNEEKTNINFGSETDNFNENKILDPNNNLNENVILENNEQENSIKITNDKKYRGTKNPNSQNMISTLPSNNENNKESVIKQIPTDNLDSKNDKNLDQSNTNADLKYLRDDYNKKKSENDENIHNDDKECDNREDLNKKISRINEIDNNPKENQTSYNLENTDQAQNTKNEFEKQDNQDFYNDLKRAEKEENGFKNINRHRLKPKAKKNKLRYPDGKGTSFSRPKKRIVKKKK